MFEKLESGTYNRGALSTIFCGERQLDIAVH